MLGGMCFRAWFGFLLAAFVVVAEAAPNIVLILADDLGYGELGCYGQDRIATPHLDRMAAEGLKFERFYAGAPVCAPSRSVLMTGRHTGHTRVRGNAPRDRREIQALRQGDVTVAELLQKAGYETALIGKWGLGHEGSEGGPERQGFGHFFGYLDQHHAHNPYPPFLIRNGERIVLRNGHVAGTGKGGAGIAATPVDFAPDLMANEVFEWIGAREEKPFFLFWSLITPHANNEGARHGRGQEVPDLGAYANKPWPLADRAHAATIARMDADVGRLFALLKERGLDERTLVFFTSDNGAHREGGNAPEFFAASGPLRGIKRDLHEGGIRVPGIVRWPGSTPAGAKSASVLGFADLLPTFAAVAGTGERVPKGLDGIDFSPLLHGRTYEPPAGRVMYWEFHEAGFSQAVLMDSRWKAIRSKSLDAPVMIYDLEGDAGEEIDLAASREDLVTRARDLFQSERSESADWPVRGE
ncbi:MAG: N-acetylgalactosamine-6-sulfatase [Verrucomicrobia bacterium]|nr:MAG: N-acetylgalactosamine-6-sulfatase [Verrucomicrobiota bacterium]TAE86730.1 MAG: N-acetylgalactosamine-6-sulfatase [Verrucomicrobiota bacterium]TAF24510.1 MAG: N-acetylgalactosamine-6-sulfatase [Verrucomicrobiota bacterium]